MGVREFPFELRLCAHLESEGTLVSRQLGLGVHAPGNRIIDVLCVEPGPAFDQRTELTAEQIPDLVIRADVGAGEARYWKEAVADLDVHPDRARAAIERGIEIGFLERERRNGRLYVRQAARYPTDWFGRLRAIENKPDLGDPGALETQLRKDVALGLCEEVILATESYVTRAHENRIPPEVGIWRVDPTAGDIDVIREPEPLPVDEPGTELIKERTGRTEVQFATPAEKWRARRRVAERAYGKGWRTHTFPGCANITADRIAGVDGLPWCHWHDRIVDPASECDPECPGYDPAEAPTVDLDAARDRTAPWVADPSGRNRTQSGLDRFE